jgi:fructose-bisphosphate aldolase class 1
MNAKAINSARDLIAGDTGLLAMDTNNATCKRRFAALGAAQAKAMRRKYRVSVSK